MLQFVVLSAGLAQGATAPQSSCIALIAKAGEAPTKLTQLLQPIRGHYVSHAINTLFKTGIYEHLKENPASLEELGNALDLNETATLEYLRTLVDEEVLEVRDGRYLLTSVGHQLEAVRGHYEMLVDGYSETFASLPESLRKGAPIATRNLGSVGKGSCKISRLGAIPLSQEFIRSLHLKSPLVLDLGCGSAGYIIELANQQPQMRVIGVEPSAEALEEGRAQARKLGISNRVTLLQGSAGTFAGGEKPNIAILGFVLHEVLAQGGEEAVGALFKNLLSINPEMYFVIFEVDKNENALGSTEQRDFYRAYYNPYNVLHTITNQRLESIDFWISFLDRNGLEILRKQSVDAKADPTGKEVGLLVRAKQSRITRADNPKSFLTQRLEYVHSRQNERHWSILVENFPTWPGGFPTLEAISSEKETQYELPQGNDDLLDAIRQREKDHYGLSLRRDEVLVTPGATGAIGLIAREFLKPGMKAFVQAPVFAGVSRLLELSGVEIAYLSLDQMLLKLQQGAVPDLIYVNSPNNPLGTVIEEAQMRVIVGAAKNGTRVIVDSVYDSFGFDKVVTSPYKMEEASLLRDQLFTVNSLSKNYGAPGDRVGWIVTSARNVEALSARLETEVVALPGSTQAKGKALLQRGNRDLVEHMRQNRHRVVEMVQKIRGAKIHTDGAGTQLWVELNVSDIEQFADGLMRDHGLVLTTSENYRGIGGSFVRIPYTYNLDHTQAALERLSEALKETEDKN